MINAHVKSWWWWCNGSNSPLIATKATFPPQELFTFTQDFKNPLLFFTRDSASNPNLVEGYLAELATKMGKVKEI